MKIYIMMVALGILPLCCVAQLAPYDLLVAKKTNSLKYTTYFLATYHGFDVIGDVGKSKEGYDVFKLSKGKDWIELLVVD